MSAHLNLIFVLFYREAGKKANIEFHSSLAVLFGVKKYADALWKVVEQRGINVNLRY